MSTRNPALTATATTANGVEPRRFVGFDGEQTGANGLARGVSVAKAEAGADFALDVLGETVVEAGGAFSAGDLLHSDANAQAVTGGTKAVARALEDATAVGQQVRIFLLPNNT